MSRHFAAHRRTARRTRNLHKSGTLLRTGYGGTVSIDSYRKSQLVFTASLTSNVQDNAEMSP